MPFLNFVYGGTRAEIKTDGIERIGELQDSIKAKYGDEIAAPPVLIQLYKSDSEERIATMADYRGSAYLSLSFYHEWRIALKGERRYLRIRTEFGRQLDIRYPN